MDHAHHGAPGAAFAAISLAAVAAATLAYLGAACAERRKGSRWSLWRTAFFMTGMGLLGIAFSPGLMGWAHEDLRGHMVQHLLIGMLAPLGLVLGAPVTLALRKLPVPSARRVTAVLRSRAAGFLSHPVTALVLNIGGMYALYMTPLYSMALTSPALHAVIHVHFLAAGYLFCWAVLAGPDAAPRPPGLPLRLGVLFVSMAAHATLGKLMYAHLWPRGTPHGVEEIQAAAQWMYYGGDFAEVLLAVALFARWYGAGGSRRHDLLPRLA